MMNELAKIRKKIFSIKNREFKPIIYNGEGLSPVEAARYVNENAGTLSFIPGKVSLYCPLPLSFDNLSALYNSNEFISNEDESELAYELPKSREFLSPSEFSDILETMRAASNEIREISHKNSLLVRRLLSKDVLTISAGDKSFDIRGLDRKFVETVCRLSEKCWKNTGARAE